MGDWERRIFLQVAATNNLKIVHIEDGSTDDKKKAPGWYRHYPEHEAEANRIFAALESEHRRGHTGPKFMHATESVAVDHPEMFHVLSDDLSDDNDNDTDY